MAKRKGKTYLSVLILVLIAILIFISRLSIFEKSSSNFNARCCIY